jgi:phosphoribosyl-ATP pyrophosphohydrolase
MAKKAVARKAAPKKATPKKAAPKKPAKARAVPVAPVIAAAAPDARVLDALQATVLSRRNANPATSHSARLLSRGTAKVAQKLGEEAVETVIEAARGNRAAVVTESADLLYHLIVVWVDAGISAAEIWAELKRREGVSGIAEKRARTLAMRQVRTRKVW